MASQASHITLLMPNTLLGSREDNSDGWRSMRLTVSHMHRTVIETIADSQGMAFLDLSSFSFVV